MAAALQRAKLHFKMADPCQAAPTGSPCRELPTNPNLPSSRDLWNPGIQHRSGSNTLDASETPHVTVIQSPSEARGLGNENGRSRSDSVSAAQGFWRRKDFGAAGGGVGGGPGVKEAGGGAGQGISSGVVCSLSVRPSVVCLLLDELVRAGLADCVEIFGGGQGPCQERLSPEPAQSAKVRPRKGREIQIWAISH